VDESVGTGNDGHMVDVTARLEEDQVTCLVLSVGVVLALLVGVLLVGRTGNLLAGAVEDCVLRETGTVETDGVGALSDAQRLAVEV